MSSVDRIFANRQNAARSTGPITAGGKLRASRNAVKHGLNVSIRHVPGLAEKIEALAVAITCEKSTSADIQVAREVAEAHLELRRIQEFKLTLINNEAYN